jgi:hypothetical protein
VEGNRAMARQADTTPLLAGILHEKKMAKTFQAFKIRLSDNSKKGIRRDKLYSSPTRISRI